MPTVRSAGKSETAMRNVQAPEIDLFRNSYLGIHGLAQPIT